jgi:hypothetical protein
MKIVVYANVSKDWQDRIRTPYGIAQFRSYITRSFITSNLPYKHPSKKAVTGDIIVWAFRVKETWYLLGDGYVSEKWESDDGENWSFWIESARLYPRGVPLDEFSFADKVKKALNVGYNMNWNEYRQLLEKASAPVV